MKYAIISDIHANLEALEAVIEDASKMGTNKFICLGDVVGYGPDPEICARKVRDICSLVVKGNHDAVVSGWDPLPMNSVATIAVEWTKEKMSSEMIGWLKNLPMKVQNEDVVYVHSTLVDPHCFNYFMSIDINFHEHFNIMESEKSRLCFLGHTHIPLNIYRENNLLSIRPDFNMNSKVYIKDDIVSTFNVGSVGQPRGDREGACYMIFNDSSGEYSVELRSVKYECSKTRYKMEAAGLPEELIRRIV